MFSSSTPLANALLCSIDCCSMSSSQLMPLDVYEGPRILREIEISLSPITVLILPRAVSRVSFSSTTSPSAVKFAHPKRITSVMMSKSSECSAEIS